jgi:hypothetical protein
VTTLETTEWEEAGADAFIDHAMPVVRAASKTGESQNVLQVYAGVLGAWYGSLVADAGPEFAAAAADILFANVRQITFKEQMN